MVAVAVAVAVVVVVCICGGGCCCCCCCRCSCGCGGCMYLWWWWLLLLVVCCLLLVVCCLLFVVCDVVAFVVVVVVAVVLVRVMFFVIQAILLEGALETMSHRCKVSGFAGLAMSDSGSKGPTPETKKRKREKGEKADKADKAEKAEKAPKTPRAPKPEASASKPNAGKRDKDKAAADLERALEWRKKLSLQNIFAGKIQRCDLYYAKRFTSVLDKNDPAEALLLENCMKVANAAIMLWPAEHSKLPIEQLTATSLQISSATIFQGNLNMGTIYQ